MNEHANWFEPTQTITLALADVGLIDLVGLFEDACDSGRVEDAKSIRWWIRRKTAQALADAEACQLEPPPTEDDEDEDEDEDDG